MASHDDIIKFSTLLALCVGISLATDEFPSQRPVTSFDVFFDLCLDKLLKQSWGWWFDDYDVTVMSSSNVLQNPENKIG